MEYPENHGKLLKNGEEPSSIVCLNCGSNQWYKGPSGGMSTNIKCVGCGLWFNYTPFGLDFIGIKGNIGEEKKIVWYCPNCDISIYNMGEVREYPTCGKCDKPLKVCWSFNLGKFPEKHCEVCSARFKCYTTRGNF